MTMTRYDVAIVGGGLVGSAMALALSAQGFQVVLIEPNAASRLREPDFDGRAYAIAPGSANLLRSLGLWDAVAPGAGPVKRIHVADRAAGPVAPGALTFDPNEGTQGDALGWIVEDHHLRRALVDAVAASDITRQDGTGTATVTRTGSDAVVTCASASPVMASVIVACDGRNSSAARQAGIRYLRWPYDQMGLASAISHAGDHGGAAHQAFFPGGPFAVLPLKGRRSALVWSERTAVARRLRDLDDAAYLREVASRIGGRLGDLTAIGRRWVYPLGLALATRFCAPRLVLAGDAAHGVHPIAGQGLNMGLRDVAALTEVLTDAARLGEDIGSTPVLTRYERWRRFDATAMSLGMDALNRIFSTDAAPLQALRNLGLAAVSNMPGARRQFMAEASGSAGSVPKLLTGRPF